MANPFNNEFFSNIFTTAFNQPFFQQNNPLANQQNFPGNVFRTQNNSTQNVNFNSTSNININGNPIPNNQQSNYQNFFQNPYQNQQQQQQQNQQQPQQQQQQFFNDDMDFEQNYPQQQQQNPYQYKYQNNNMFTNKNNGSGDKYHNQQKKEENKSNKKKQQQNLNSGFYWKDQGNLFYKQNNFEKALDSYTKAIELNDTVSIFFSNRARCYRQLKKYDLALKDAIQAIELDDKNIKGYLICGQCLAQIGKFEQKNDKIENSINKMIKAQVLCAGQAGQNQQIYEKELQIYILRAKKLLWYKRKFQDIQLFQQSLQLFNQSIDQNQNLSEEEKTTYKNFMAKKNQDQQMKESDFIIPDIYCCKITLDIMEDPYITPAGVTYEGSVLKQHIETNGSFDPVTREPIQKEMIYPNLAVKHAIREFIEKNPWAFEFKSNENYLDIDFFTI